MLILYFLFFFSIWAYQQDAKKSFFFLALYLTCYQSGLHHFSMKHCNGIPGKPMKTKPLLLDLMQIIEIVWCMHLFESKRLRLRGSQQHPWRRSGFEFTIMCHPMGVILSVCEGRGSSVKRAPNFWSVDAVLRLLGVFYDFLFGEARLLVRRLWVWSLGLLPTGWVGWTSLNRSHGLPAPSLCGSTWNCQTSVLGLVREIA